MDDKRRTTTKDVALLLQLRAGKQLTLAPEFQRSSVWPRPAKAYLIDTMLSDRPIPLLFFSRAINAQTGRSEYEVIDGQQRLRAVFEFVDGRFSLTESEGSPWFRKKWNTLEDRHKQRLLNYDFTVEELSGYSQEDVRDMFRRMNRYVVPLNAQEQRHAVDEGQFKAFAEDVGSWSYWVETKIFSKNAAARRKTDEFAAELAILLSEGPQDKKQTLDLYFKAYKDEFPMRNELRERLLRYMTWLGEAVPNLPTMQLRRPANFYAVIGALDNVTNGGEKFDQVSASMSGALLVQFDEQLKAEEPNPTASRYLRAASRQTDNLQPRQTRIQILSGLLQVLE